VRALREFQPPFDAVDPALDAVDPDRQMRDGRLQLADIALDAAHGDLEGADPGRQLVDFLLQPIEPAVHAGELYSQEVQNLSVVAHPCSFARQASRACRRLARRSWRS